MRINDCELIRQELDELSLDEAWSSHVADHLRECSKCSEFHDQQTRLRRIVGSLGTVAAPADFDFRLRARLANESASVVSQFNFFSSAFARRGLATAILLLVFASGAFVLRNALMEPNNASTRTGNIAQQPATDQSSPTREVEKPPVPVEAPLGGQESSGVRVADKRSSQSKHERPSQLMAGSKRTITTLDSSFDRAEVINGNMPPAAASAAFPIDASSQPFRISLDDGRGNAKVISVPTISFGSQRIVQTANRTTPKRAW